MMHRLFPALLLLLALVSCTREPVYPESQVIELTLSTGDDMSTRAGADGVKDGEDAYNENLISWVEFFFYPAGETDADAVYHVRRESGKRRSDVMRLELTSEQVNGVLFPSAPADVRTCTVIAFVNYPGTLVEEDGPLTGTSLPELESRVVSTDFVTPENHRQTRFLMSGRADLALRGRAQVVAASGQIDLSRYACKLTVGVDVIQEVTVGLEKWHPMIDGMELYLVNGVDDVTLGGRKEDDPHYFSYRNNALPFAYTDLDGQLHYYFEKEGNYCYTYPTYMYPQRWVYGSSESPVKEPYLKLVVPWRRETDPEHGILSTQKQFYYKVIIPDDRREEFRRTFARNNWYHIDIRVGILGSETDEAQVIINNGWVYIFDWQDREVVVKEVNITSARYLSVEKELYELHNIESARLRYTTSHPVLMKDIRVRRPYYGTAAAGTVQFGGTVRTAGAGDIYPQGSKYLEYSEEQRRALNGGEDWFSDDGTAIVYQHPLDNNYLSKTSFDYSPYTITLALVHADRPDDTSYRREMTLVQYPAIYIQSTPNPDPLTGPGGKPLHWGYVYIDNEQYTLAQYDIDSNNDADVAWRQDHLWRVVYYSSGGRDMYRINVTVLPADSEFVIGDPREDAEDNLRPADDYFHDGPALEGGTRSLEHYYPTEASDRTVNMIAPAYRISTKLSGIEHDGITLQKARERCASFQENGFPAGRWRLPTKGEVRFISQLSANGYFEWQFGGNYWSANGALYVNRYTGEVTDSDPNRTIALLRCVYDSWYWGDDQLDDVTQFTWADAAR